MLLTLYCVNGHYFPNTEVVMDTDRERQHNYILSNSPTLHGQPEKHVIRAVSSVTKDDKVQNAQLYTASEQCSLQR